MVVVWVNAWSVHAQSLTMIEGPVSAGPGDNCWLLLDLASGTTFALLGAGEELQSPGIIPTVWGEPQPDQSGPCGDAIPFVVAGYRLPNAWPLWPPVVFVVSPASPTHLDQITLTLADFAPSGCVPTDLAVSVDANPIRIQAYNEYPEGTFCNAMVTPWTLSTTIGVLPAGTYAVEAQFVDRGQIANDWAPCGTLVVRTAGDFDSDGDVDARDRHHLRQCARGGKNKQESSCQDADLNRDGCLDEQDQAIFEACFNGPNRPPACE